MVTVEIKIVLDMNNEDYERLRREIVRGRVYTFESMPGFPSPISCKCVYKRKQASGDTVVRFTTDLTKAVAAGALI